MKKQARISHRFLVARAPSVRQIWAHVVPSDAGIVPTMSRSEVRVRPEMACHGRSQQGIGEKCGLWLLTVALALLSGCSFLEPQPDHTRYFVLDGSNLTDSPTDFGTDSPVIGVGPVRLPDYLRRVEIVRRVAANRLHISSDEQWGEALDVGFGRALAQDLGRRLRNPAVVRLPGLASLRVDIEVPVEVVRFEADEKGDVHLVARWIVKPTREGGKRVARESRIHEAAAGPATTAVVEAMGRAIATLANDIATAIEMLPSPASRAH